MSHAISHEHMWKPTYAGLCNAPAEVTVPPNTVLHCCAFQVQHANLVIVLNWQYMKYSPLSIATECKVNRVVCYPATPLLDLAAGLRCCQSADPLLLGHVLFLLYSCIPLNLAAKLQLATIELILLELLHCSAARFSPSNICFAEMQHWDSLLPVDELGGIRVVPLMIVLLLLYLLLLPKLPWYNWAVTVSRMYVEQNKDIKGYMMLQVQLKHVHSTKSRIKLSKFRCPAWCGACKKRTGGQVRTSDSSGH